MILSPPKNNRPGPGTRWSACTSDKGVSTAHWLSKYHHCKTTRRCSGQYVYVGFSRCKIPRTSAYKIAECSGSEFQLSIFLFGYLLVSLGLPRQVTALKSRHAHNCSGFSGQSAVSTTYASSNRMRVLGHLRQQFQPLTHPITHPMTSPMTSSEIPITQPPTSSWTLEGLGLELGLQLED